MDYSKLRTTLFVLHKGYFDKGREFLWFTPNNTDSIKVSLAYLSTSIRLLVLISTRSAGHIFAYTYQHHVEEENGNFLHNDWIKCQKKLQNK